MTWCVKTVTIQIGNSDDKLSQRQWAEFVGSVNTAISQCCEHVHFSGSPAGTAPWQNAAWVVEVPDHSIPGLKRAVTAIRQSYSQDSAAWTEGETKFI